MGLRGKAWDAVGIGKVPGILGELDPNFDAQIAEVSHDRRFDGTDIRRARHIAQCGNESGSRVADVIISAS